LDEVDRGILELLRSDSRLAYTKIAEALGLSEGTVRQRVQKLLKSGVIRRFTIETADERPEALVLVSTSPAFSTSKVAEQILTIDGVKSVSELAGRYDVSVIVSGEEIASVNKSIDDIRGIEGVQDTHTLFVLRKWR
jgi:DNA-binding Lrp family transcriptional regulator